MKLRGLIASHLWPYKQLLGMVVVLQAVQTTATLTIPALSADLIDNGVLAGDNAYIWRQGGVMLACALVQICFALAAVRFGAKAAMCFGRDIRRDLFHQVTGYSAREVGHFGAPSLITRITNDVQQVQLLVVMATTMMIAAPLMMIVGLVMAVREDVGLSVVLAVAIPFAVGVLAVVISFMVPAFQLMQVRIDRVNTVLRDQITGVKVVRAFVREPQETERFADANTELTSVSLRAGRLMSTMFPTVGLIVNLASLGVLWVGADRIASGDTQIGSLIAYLTYVVQVLISVVMVTFMVSMIPRAGVAAERIVEVLQTEPTVRPAAKPVTDVAEHGTLEFRGVGFRYPGAETSVLRNISFRIEPGQTTAVIGSTGSGKTTLVNLVPRLFDATTGAVLVDGVDVRELEPDLLWDRIGYVPRRPTSSRAPWRRTYASGGPTQARATSGRRSRSPRLPVSSRLCPTVSKARSTRAARTCRVGSASAWRSPVRWWSNPRSMSLTTRSQRWTSRPTPACEPRSLPTHAPPRCSSWLSAYRPSRTPTRSWCSTTAESSARGLTTICSTPARPTRRSSSLSTRRP
jgi:ATP-binding cassette subfamily B multidrug efflux pump